MIYVTADYTQQRLYTQKSCHDIHFLGKQTKCRNFEYNSVLNDIIGKVVSWWVHTYSRNTAFTQTCRKKYEWILISLILKIYKTFCEFSNFDDPRLLGVTISSANDTY